jgi:hypothetical protein
MELPRHQASAKTVGVVGRTAARLVGQLYGYTGILGRQYNCRLQRRGADRSLPRCEIPSNGRFRDDGTVFYPSSRDCLVVR